MNEDLLLERIHALTTPLAAEPTDLSPRLPLINGVRAVLFDVYGTLVISASGDIHACTGANPEAAYQEALATLPQRSTLAGLPTGPATLKHHIRNAHDRARASGIDYPEVDILDVWRNVLTPLSISLTTAQLSQIAIEYEFRVNPVWPMPAMAPVLRALRERDLTLGIISNAQFYTPLMLQAFLSRPLTQHGFNPDACTWSYQLGYAKPSPRIFAHALTALRDHAGIAPHQVLYIGNDMRNDISPAQRLGMKTALFAGDRRSLRLREDDTALYALQSDAIITDLPQLIHLLPIP